MADFCKQCSIATFGEDYGDFAGLQTEEDTANNLVTSVLCEGCGPTEVDHTGECVALICDEDHQGQRERATNEAEEESNDPLNPAGLGT